MRNFVEVQGKAILVIHAGAAYIPCPNENLSDAGCKLDHAVAPHPVLDP